MMNKAATEKAILMAAFARFDPVALAVALGSVFALLLFIATAALLLQGGEVVGPHLSLLGIYLPGYDVSWIGGFIGAAYFWVIGAAVGASIAILWNMTHYIYVAVVVVRAAWWKMMAE
jgi:hypothetical protein